MKKITAGAFLTSLIVLSGCKNNESTNTIKFVTSADNPPFEYYEGGEIKGFEIDLAKLVAKELGKEAIIENMQFSTLLPALEEGSVDAAIATLGVTETRKKNFDFSDTYYQESMAMVYPTAKPITEKSHISHKKIACQLGSTMELWLKKNVPDTEIVAMDTNNQSIEALKAGHMDGIFNDDIQAATFCKNNPGLSYSIITSAEAGIGIAFKKGSPLKDQINVALKSLETKGEIQKLKQKWLEVK